MYYNRNTEYKKCTILLHEDIYKRLRTKGRFGESFSKLISRLLDEIDYLELSKRGDKIENGK